ncbi:N-acetyltransferase [Olivibacter sp. XZL3]|uniref:GNAT family N-acetyltransferase n=1 Tax=Olivibacter sp. XZL3 TaxID=1735116 RepID=UPI00106665C2|nr:GNAT family N-acetyltransferase [Olivibacter sp. XZL3]
MYEVRQLKRSDRNLVKAICESLKTAYDPNVSRFFVHQDNGYLRFFQSVLDHPSYATYYVYNTASNELCGFACFQFLDGIIFLKHIVVDNRVRGSRIGTTLLTRAMDDIRSTLPARDYLFQLHVFEKNSRALSWYLSIGMEPLDCTYWYDLQAAIAGEDRLDDLDWSSFHIKADDFGFQQLYYGSTYIGTILAGRTLIVKNQALLACLKLLKAAMLYKNLTSIGYISEQKLAFNLVDKALLMSKPVNQLELV